MKISPRIAFLVAVMARTVSCFSPPSFVSKTQSSRFMGQSMKLVPVPRRANKSTMNMFLGSDGGLLGIGAPEVVSGHRKPSLPRTIAENLSLSLSLPSPVSHKQSRFQSQSQSQPNISINRPPSSSSDTLFWDRPIYTNWSRKLGRSFKTFARSGSRPPKRWKSIWNRNCSLKRFARPSGNSTMPSAFAGPSMSTMRAKPFLPFHPKRGRASSPL
jgi:hypothetical protein